MGKPKTDRTKHRLIRAINYNAHRLAEQHITQAIVKEEQEQEQDVKFDGLIRTGMIIEESMLKYQGGGVGEGGVRLTDSNTLSVKL